MGLPNAKLFTRCTPYLVPHGKPQPERHNRVSLAPPLSQELRKVCGEKGGVPLHKTCPERYIFSNKNSGKAIGVKEKAELQIQGDRRICMGLPN